MRIIDADALKASIEEKDRYNLGGEGRIVVCGMLDDAPTIDAEPVKHGWWIKLDRDIAVCSECGRHENALLVDSYPYCHCGAKMDGGAEDEC